MAPHHLLALLCLVGCASAQEPAQRCPTCAGHGTLPCRAHGRDLALEQPAHGTLFCSVAAQCARCAGALAVDCPRCADAGAEAALAARRRRVAEWMEQRRLAVDALLPGRPVLHLRTAHCELAFTIRFASGRKQADPHRLMHLYGERIEHEWQLFRDTLALADEDLPGTLHVHMFEDEEDHERLAPQVTGIVTTNTTGAKRMGEPCVYSMWRKPALMPDDEALHRTVAHNVAHLLVSNMRPSVWLGDCRHGWIDAGVAHWFEDALTGRCTSYCFEEALLVPDAAFESGRWRAPVRRLVTEGRATSFAVLSARNTDQLTAEEHALAFAYVDFLLSAQGGAQFRDLVRLVKADVPTREALPKACGLDILTIDAAFARWVEGSYPRR